MKLEGIIKKIIADGYERLIYLSLATKTKKLWCHLIQHEKGGPFSFPSCKPKYNLKGWD
ncbi:hypothetical protein P4H67_02705 [Paenibacillus lautus]|uniref:hypothetical protein n=1 Tax=Paenibacillus lautus TaxID=1401 RepID=UPI002DB701EC|nr:hypothetical protein [Paenibacillus lautus]MEC0305677.1 hypothetical protein [Paenibacillus lautus]